MVRLLKHMKAKEWAMVIVSIAFIVLQVQLDLKLPDYMSDITVLVQTKGSEMSDIFTAGGKMMGCALGSLASAIVVGFFAAKIAANFSKRLREDVYDKVMSYTDKEINSFSTASLITRTTNDITQIQFVIALGLQVMIKAPIMAVMAVAKISSKNFEWTALTLAIVAFVIFILLFVVIFALPKFKKIQWLTDDLNRVTRENLTGLMVVRAYNAEDYQEEKFDKANNRLTKNNLQAYLVMSIMNPGLNLAMNGLTLGIYWIGAILINNVALTGMAAIKERVGLFSDMVVFTSYAMQVLMAFLLLVMIFILLPRATVAAKRINEVLDTEVSMKDGVREQGEESLKGEVEFKNVSFAYPDAADNVIHNINFKAHRGETVALIGATGSGKSTIINLIPRIYDATEGQILVDGVNVKDYSEKSLRDKIGFVPQKAYLFSGTIESNVGYGEAEVNMEDISKAVEIAQAKEFVENQPGEYDGMVAQGGGNFSGGQKQRLSIARAIAKQPEILVFDDSFSALDYKTDRVLRETIKKEIADTTNIIVAQRIGTIKDADRILVIEDGAIVGNGTHSELMKNCPLYQEIAYSQLSKEELEKEEV